MPQHGSITPCKLFMYYLKGVPGITVMFQIAGQNVCVAIHY